MEKDRRDEMINVFGSSVGETELKEVTESIGNQWMGMGPKTKEFEKRMGGTSNEQFSSDRQLFEFIISCFKIIESSTRVRGYPAIIYMGFLRTVCAFGRMPAGIL